MKIIAYILVALGLGTLAVEAGNLGAAFALPGKQLFYALASELLVPLSSILLAGIAFYSTRIARFLSTFIGTLAGAHVILVVLLLLKYTNSVPFGWDDYIPPALMAIAASIVAALIYACSYVPVIRTIMAIGDRYFRAEEPGTLSLGPLGTLRMREGSIGVLLLAVIISINLIQVALNVRLNFYSRDMYNALQVVDASAFWYQILVIFVSFATIWVIVGLTELLMRYFLTIRWRAYLNRHYVDHWLKDGLHYEMQLTNGKTDNPDQRIAADLPAYIGGQETLTGTFDLSLSLLSQVATLVSFLTILWGLSAGFTLPGTSMQVPGLLVWIAMLYAALGTWLIHVIGKPLIGLNFRKEQVEADYRFSLARIREYGEQIALLDGQHAEAERLHGRFGAIIGNYMDIAWRMMKIVSFRFSFGQLSAIFPMVLVAPYYFSKQITLGQMTQTAGAFGSVQEAFNFFITAYTVLAAYKAVVNRLTSFEAALEHSVEELHEHPPASLEPGKGKDIDLDRVTVRLPNGQVLMADIDLTFRKGEATLVNGPSGSGKSTLFRTLVGIWPFSSGTIRVPENEAVMELPQRPYIPEGNLRDAVTYPAVTGTFSDAEIADALKAVKLDQFADHLDDERLWNQTLSGGEQQRLAVARALLARPDWLLLDEATAAIDEQTEAELYSVIKQRLPQTTVISIGHRSTLKAFHGRHVELRKQDGAVVLADAAVTV